MRAWKAKTHLAGTIHDADACYRTWREPANARDAVGLAMATTSPADSIKRPQTDKREDYSARSRAIGDIILRLVDRHSPRELQRTIRVIDALGA
jgi:hypothetical protein